MSSYQNMSKHRLKQLMSSTLRVLAAFILMSVGSLACSKRIKPQPNKEKIPDTNIDNKDRENIPALMYGVPYSVFSEKDSVRVSK